MTHNQIMERINDDIPFEHQMMFIVKDYDRKVEENMELRKEVEELSAALEKQGVQLHDAKVDLKNEIKKEEEAEKALKKKPTFDEKVLQKQMTDLKKKNKILSKQVNQLHRTLQYVRNRTWTLLEENFIPELEKLELQMRETLEKYEEMAWDLHQKRVSLQLSKRRRSQNLFYVRQTS